MHFKKGFLGVCQATGVLFRFRLPLYCVYSMREDGHQGKNTVRLHWYLSRGCSGLYVQTFVRVY